MRITSVNSFDLLTEAYDLIRTMDDFEQNIDAQRWVETYEKKIADKKKSAYFYDTYGKLIG